MWLKDARTYHVQGWLNQIGAGKLSRNTLKHVKSVVSGIFTLAKQQDYFQGENPARDSAINPKAAEPQETYAYTLEEIQTILSLLPEPQQRPSPSRHSWDCGMAKFRAYCRRTTGTEKCTFLVRSGMAASQTPRPARAVPRFLSSDSWRIGWKSVGYRQKSAEWADLR